MRVKGSGHNSILATRRDHDEHLWMTATTKHSHAIAGAPNAAFSRPSRGTGMSRVPGSVLPAFRQRIISAVPLRASAVLSPCAAAA